MNLGFKEQEYFKTCGCEDGDKEEKKEPKILFPSVTIQGPAASAIMRNCAVDDEITVTIKCRVARQEERSKENTRAWETPGCQVELELKDLTAPGMKESDGDDKEETASEAFSKYREKKGKTSSEDKD